MTRPQLPAFRSLSARIGSIGHFGFVRDLSRSSRSLGRTLALLAGLLAAPVQLAAVQIDLTWQDNSTNESGFTIERAIGSGTYGTLATTAANATSYTDTTVAASTTYNYRVAAFNSAGTSAFSNVFTITTPASTPTNTAPTISNITNRTINEDADTGAVAFTVGDAETAAATLTVSGSSSNTTLVPNSTITFGGSGASRTVTVTPAANQSGSATITVTVSDGALSASDTFTLTVSAVNDTPTISNITNRTIDQDTNTGAVAFTIADVETAAGSLTVSGSSSNTALVPNTAITFGGSGANRTVTVTPAAGQSGSATITVTVSDGGASASDTFTLTVNAVAPANSAPTISNITNRTINEDAETGAVAFTIADAESEAGTLTVSGSSSNTTLVPGNAITFGGSGASRTVTVTPAANQSGSATITVTVSDGVLSGTDTFTLTVTAVNDIPAISDLANRAIDQDTDTGAISFIIADVETAAGSLTVSGSSSNTTLVPNAAITFGGSGANRTVTVTPAAGQSGSATITVTVSDASASTSDAFVLTVNAVAPANTTPTISNLTNRTINEDDDTGAVAFTVGDAESTAGALTVSGSSSNTTLVPNSAITFGGSGSTRNVTVTPAANQSGSATITITVSDGELTATDTFTLTVSAVNDTPTISGVANQAIDQDTNTGAIAFTIADVETAAGSLTVSGSSSNPALVPNSAITFGGSGVNRTVTVTPAAGQSGSATITITVSDGGASASDAFVLTVNAVAPANTAPTISTISNQSVAQDAATAALAFTVGDAESAASTLTVLATSSNTTVVPNNAITLAGTGANRTVTVTPAAGQSGSATITLTVSDGTDSASTTFVLTVTATNNPPTISDIADQVIEQDADTGALAFTVRDTESSSFSLAVAGSSSNPALVPNSGIVFGGFGANRTVRVTPVAGQSGTATITISVSDGTDTTSDTFDLTVSAVAPANNAPTISNVASQTINEDAATSALAFLVDDIESAATSLTVTATSSNSSLVPDGTIVLGGSGASRTVTVTPAADASGSTTITLTVSDGELTSTDMFVVTVTAVNDTPTLSDIADQSIARDAATSALAFTITDVETAATALTVTGTSSNPTLVPNSGITFGGSGANRTVTVNPAAGQSGTALITITVSDGAASASDTFTLTVNAPVNTAPTISNIFSRTITEDGTTGAVNFTINDAETTANALVVTFASSNSAVIPLENITLGGSGGTRTITAIPAPDQSGFSTITVTVSDGTLSDSDTFRVTVSAVNDAPSVTTIAAQTIAQDSATSALAFNVADGESAAGSLTVSGTSSNAVLVPASGITFGGSGGNRTVTITPAAGQSGATTITLVVSDSAATATSSFVVTVTAVAPADTPPTVSPIPSQAGNSDGSIGPVAFSISDNETGAASLAVTATSSNPTLVPTANVVVSGTGASRHLTITPAAGQVGTATITVTVSDGTNSTSTTFTVSIAAAPIPESRMLNMSTRVVCRPGAEALIPGFVITGSASKRVLLRAVGPTLGGDPYNVPDTLPNPRMVLKRWNGSAFVDLATNDDWGLNANAAAIRTTSNDVSAFPLAEGSTDAVLLLDLTPGQYTVVIDDPTGAEGVVIVELYDTDPTATGTNLINMSNRGFVGTGAEVMISGFVVSAEAPKTLLIRAIGPGLAVAPYHVPNTISDPTFQIFRRETSGSDTLVLSHDNWSDGPLANEVAQVANEVSAFPLPAGSKDAAVVATLEPGVYTVVVSGVNGATGTALVEVYTVE